MVDAFVPENFLCGKEVVVISSRKVNSASTMERKLILMTFTVLVFFYGDAQTILVNSDGTHSVIIDHGGGTSIQVNPNGTHTIIFNNGTALTKVNPDGTHTIVSTPDTMRPPIARQGNRADAFNTKDECDTISHDSIRQSSKYFKVRPRKFRRKTRE
jgi:hypothetical protein